MKKISKPVLMLLGFLICNSCGSIYEQEPVGIGKDPATLKQSPCACLEVKPLPGLPDWVFTGEV